MNARGVSTPIALVVLAAGTAAYAYFVDGRRASDADRAARRQDVFPSFRVDNVERIELVHGREKVVLVRGDATPPVPRDGSARPGPAAPRDVWQMIEPRPEATDAAAVDALLRELEMATRVRDVQEDDAAGLEAPRARGSVKVGPLDYRFAVGADAVAPEGAAYMRVDGEGTFVIGRSLKVQLLRGADAYRDRALVPYGASEVARVEVHARSGGFVLDRRGTSFRVGGPTGLRASSPAIEHLFGALAEARAEAFLEDAAADRLISDSALAVVVTPRDSSLPPIRLLVGGSCWTTERPSAVRGDASASERDGSEDDVVVVRTEPARMSACVPRGLTEALAVTPGALVDEAPFVAHADEIEEVRIERMSTDGAPGPRVDLARRGAGWHERSPEDRDLEPDQADSANVLVAALAGARAVEVRQTLPGERISVVSRATIVRTGMAASEIIEVGPPEVDGTALARRVDDGAVLRLSRAVARRFEPHPIALEGHAVWRAPVDPASVVALDDSCGGATERLELQSGVWKSRAFDVDGVLAADLVGSIARAKADGWVAESGGGSFGLDGAESCAVTLTLNAAAGGVAARRVGIVFGDAGEGGVYARALDATSVFLVPASMRERASHPAIDRSRFRIDTATLVRAVLVRNGAKVVLAREHADDPLLRIDADGSVPDDKLQNGFDGFAAEFAAHAGPPTGDEGIGRPTLEIKVDGRGAAGVLVNTSITVGAPTHGSSGDGYFARVAGVDATFVVSKRVVNAFLDTWPLD